MFTQRVTTLAFQVGSITPRTLSNSSRTLANGYRRFSRSNVSYCTTETAHASNDDVKNTSEENGQPPTIDDRIISLTKENNVLKDKYQRALADRENTRIRLEKKISDARIFGIQNFCKDLLEVSDVFKKALENVPQESIRKTDSDIQNFYDGIIMTETQLHTVFSRHGLKQFEPKVGEKFDTSFQEAMVKIPTTNGQEAGTVASVFRTGWKIQDRCIRSAQVSVYKES